MNKALQVELRTPQSVKEIFRGAGSGPSGQPRQCIGVSASHTHKRPAEGIQAAPRERMLIEDSAGPSASRPTPSALSPLEHPGHGAGRGNLGMPWAPRTFSGHLEKLLKALRPRHQEPNREAATPESNAAAVLFRSRRPQLPAAERPVTLNDRHCNCPIETKKLWLSTNQSMGGRGAPPQAVIQRQWDGAEVPSGFFRDPRAVARENFEAS